MRTTPKQEWRPKPIEAEKPVITQDEDKYDLDASESPIISNDSPPRKSMDINIVFALPIEFHAMDEAGIAQFSLGPEDT